MRWLLEGFGGVSLLTRNEVVLGKLEGVGLMRWNFEGFFVLVAERR